MKTWNSEMAWYIFNNVRSLHVSQGILVNTVHSLNIDQMFATRYYTCPLVRQFYLFTSKRLVSRVLFTVTLRPGDLIAGLLGGLGGFDFLWLILRVLIGDGSMPAVAGTVFDRCSWPGGVSVSNVDSWSMCKRWLWLALRCMLNRLCSGGGCSSSVTSETQFF